MEVNDKADLEKAGHDKAGPESSENTDLLPLEPTIKRRQTCSPQMMGKEGKKGAIKNLNKVTPRENLTKQGDKSNFVTKREMKAQETIEDKFNRLMNFNM